MHCFEVKDLHIRSKTLSVSSSSMASLLLQILVFSSLHLISPSSQKETRFIFEDFLDQENLYLDASAKVHPGGVLQLTNTSKYQIGHAFYDKPLDLSSSFATHFVCVLVKKPTIEGGHGIAFIVSPSMDFSHAQPTRYLGVFEPSTLESPSSHVLAVELDTIWNPEFNDIKGKNHVGIDVNTPVSVAVAPASYYSDIERKNESMNLLSGKPIQVWVDYEGTLLNVSIAPPEVQKPSRPLLSHPINLAEIFPNISKFYVGFSAATGNAVSDQFILGWSFSTDRASLQRLDISKIAELPYPTGTDKKLLALFIILFGILAIVGLSILA